MAAGLAVAAKAAALTLVELGSIGFFLWSSYVLAHLLVGAA